MVIKFIKRIRWPRHGRVDQRMSGLVWRSLPRCGVGALLFAGGAEAASRSAVGGWDLWFC